MRTEQPAGDGERPRAPLHRNPWFWGVLAGLIFVPAIRPLTRHIPDAPPVLAEIPDFELRLSNGAVARSAELRGRVYVLGFHGAVCEPECGATLPALRALSDRFQEFERGITVLAVHLLASDTLALSLSPDLEGLWLATDARVDALEPLARDTLNMHIAALEAGPGRIAAVARQAQIFIVDAQGHLRGHYGIDELALDEVYHRAQHVLRDHRKDGLVPR